MFHRCIVSSTYPAVVIFVEQPDELSGLQFQFIIHGGLEVKLDPVDSRVCWTTGGSNSSSAGRWLVRGATRFCLLYTELCTRGTWGGCLDLWRNGQVQWRWSIVFTYGLLALQARASRGAERSTSGSSCSNSGSLGRRRSRKSLTNGICLRGRRNCDRWGSHCAIGRDRRSPGSRSESSCKCWRV